MTKNIIITGVSRAGKSTLADILFKKLASHNYSLINLDKPIDKWKECSNPKVSTDPNVWKALEFSSEAQDLAIRIINEKSQNKDKNYIFECAHPAYNLDRFLDRLPNPENFTIVCLSHGKNTTLKSLLQTVNSNDTPDDWSYFEKSNILEFKLFQALKIDANLSEVCAKNKIDYFITSRRSNRDSYLNSISDIIITKI